MKYSDVFLTDDNFDDELEKLSEVVGVHFHNCDGFVENLDAKFKCQTHPLGFEEWIIAGSYPCVECDCQQAYQKGKLAYEFGNGFIVLNFSVLLI